MRTNPGANWDVFSRHAKTRAALLVACVSAATTPTLGQPLQFQNTQERAVWISRAEELSKAGDFAAARLLLRRAAEAEKAPAVPPTAGADGVRIAAMTHAQQAGILPPGRRDEIATFMSRAEELLKAGDVAAARVLLRRATEAGNARAALKLGETYDPHPLQPLRGRSILPDASLACAWYEKAKDFGSTEASARVEFWANELGSSCRKISDVAPFTGW